MPEGYSFAKKLDRGCKAFGRRIVETGSHKKLRGNSRKNDFRPAAKNYKKLLYFRYLGVQNNS
jgi:hypothetical protein